MVVVEEATAVSPELIDALGRLLPQLSSAAAPPDETALAELLASPATRLLVAREATGEATGRIVGTLTLVCYRIPYEKRAWIEDVVVDGGARRHGVGEALTRAALQLASEAGARTVYLQTTPGREAAHRLYRRLGFARREATLYRLAPPPA